MAKNRLVLILKKRTMATMLPIELDGIARQKPSHQLTPDEPIYKGVPIGIVPKDFTALNSTHNDVVKRARRINSGFSWHAEYK